MAVVRAMGRLFGEQRAAGTRHAIADPLGQDSGWAEDRCEAIFMQDEAYILFRNQVEDGQNQTSRRTLR
jgi:hypothetical protein